MTHDENGLRQPSGARRATELARELAQGVVNEFWSAELLVTYAGGGSDWTLFGTETHESNEAEQAFYQKWHGQYPSDSLLLALGFLTLVEMRESYDRRYFLTDKALSLLERPAAPPSVFISYKRDQSSALALLIEARLKLVGNPNPFVDKNLTPGDEWHGKLEDTIANCEYFVCLVGRETLQSAMVLKEIQWAEKADCRIVSIWHGCKVDDATPDILKRHHFIEVTGESALEYETAVSQLLNALGYQTY